MTKVFQVAVPIDVYEDLSVKAQTKQMNVGMIVREMIKEFLGRPSLMKGIRDGENNPYLPPTPPPPPVVPAPVTVPSKPKSGPTGWAEPDPMPLGFPQGTCLDVNGRGETKIHVDKPKRPVGRPAQWRKAPQWMELAQGGEIFPIHPSSEDAMLCPFAKWKDRADNLLDVEGYGVDPETGCVLDISGVIPTYWKKLPGETYFWKEAQERKVLHPGFWNNANPVQEYTKEPIRVMKQEVFDATGIVLTEHVDEKE